MTKAMIDSKHLALLVTLAESRWEQIKSEHPSKEWRNYRDSIKEALGAGHDARRKADLLPESVDTTGPPF